MFKLVDNPTFKHRVTAMVPIDGGHQPESFFVTYNVLPNDKAQDFDLTTNEGTTKFLCAIVNRLDDICDAEGNAIEYTESVRDEVFRMPYARAAITGGYFQAISKAKKGN